MPLTLEIQCDNEQPLGGVDDVISIIDTRINGFTAYRDPSIDEKLAAMPADIRELYVKTVGHLPPFTRGDYQVEGLSLEFNFGSTDPITRFLIDVRGNGNPMPVLRKLIGDSDWFVVDPAGRKVDLNAHTLECWTDFTTYRDSAATDVHDSRDGGCNA